MTHTDNLILNSLSDVAYQRLSPHLQLVSLSKNDSLCVIGKQIEDVYFPVNALISMQNDLPDGFVTETAIIGNGSMVGAGVCCGSVCFNHAIVRAGGLAYRLSIKELLAAVHEDRTLMLLLFSAADRLLKQMSQNLTCRSHHSVDERLAKYLLITMVKTGVNDVDATHQEIANSLGVRRESVTLALKALEEQEAIRLERSTVCVRDRQALHQRVCDCFEQLDTGTV